jgi:hypothetical protein
MNQIPEHETKQYSVLQNSTTPQFLVHCVPVSQFGGFRFFNSLDSLDSLNSFFCHVDC